MERKEEIRIVAAKNYILIIPIIENLTFDFSIHEKSKNAP